jgi:25S rRNA (uracil2843-N3)-methyltransferase
MLNKVIYRLEIPFNGSNKVFEYKGILSMIRKACMETFARKDFLSTLQAIKSSFVQRDYEGIFTDPVNLAVYSAAYTPGRALCYYEIFSRPKLLKLLSKKTNVLCVGSGSGSELCAIAAAMTRVPQERQAVRLMMQDIGHYEKILESFEGTIRDRFLLTETHLKCEYQQGDVLEEDYNVEEMAKADLITFMFVMNELFVKKAAAMKMIQKLITSMKKGAYLLVSLF